MEVNNYKNIPIPTAEFLLNGDASNSYGTDGVATNISWIDSSRGYTKEVGNFNGSSSYVNAGNTTTDNAKISISMFVKLNADTGGQQWIISQESGTLSSTASFAFRWLNSTSTTGYWSFYYRTTSGTFPEVKEVSARAIPIGEWEQVTVVMDVAGGDMKLYINNVEAGNTAITLNRVNNTTNIRIGQRAGGTGSNVNGQIGLARIYDGEALTTDQIHNLYIEGQRLLGNAPAYPELLKNTIAYYDFRGDANDIIGQANGVVNGATLTTDHLGRANSAYSFDGVNDYVGNITSLPYGNANTISFWMKTTQTTKAHIFADQNVGGYKYNNLELNVTAGSGNIRWFLANTASNRVRRETIGGGFATGEWVHIALVNDGNAQTIYKNGVSVPLSENIDDGTFTGFTGTDLNIGRRDSSGGLDYLNGDMSMYMFQDRALSADEVRAMYELTQSEYIYPFGKSEAIREQITADVIDTTGLVAEYNLNGNANDSFGTNNGAASNVTWVGQGLGEVGDFNGTSSGISLPTTVMGGNFTISTWVKFDDLVDYQEIIMEHNEGPRSLYEFRSNGNKLQYVLNNGTYNGVDGTITLTAGEWYHCVYQYESSTGTRRGYINSVLDAEDVNASYTGMTFDGALSYIGNYENVARYLNGQIGLVKKYNSILSEQEIHNLYIAGQRTLGLNGVNTIFSNLEAYYPFDGSARDMWKGNNGTVNGATLTTDHLGNANSAYSFTPDSDIIIATGINTLPTEYTFAQWIKIDTLTDLMWTYFHRGGSSNPDIGILINTSGIVYYYHRNSSLTAFDVLSNSGLNTGQYYHIVGTWDGATMKLYIDGVAQTDTASPTSIGPLNDLYIGSDNGISNRGFDGTIDDTIFIHRALSAEEITHLYNQTSYRSYLPYQDLGINNKGLVMHLDGEGNDLSGNDNHGTPTNVTKIRKNQSEGGSFNGSSSFMSVANSTSINLTKNFSLSAKIKGDVLSGLHGIFSKITDGSDKQFSLSIGSSVLRFDYEKSNNNEVKVGTTTLSTGNTYNITITLDSSLNFKAYIDGVEEIAYTFPTETTATAENLIIGRWGGTYDTYYFDGEIIEPKMWNRALSEKEIKSEFYLNYL